MKRLLSSLLALVFVVGVCVSAPITANAGNVEMEEYIYSDGIIFRYDEDAKECYMKKWTTDIRLFTLQETIKINDVDYDIVGILSGAFSECTALETITIKSGVL